MTFCHVTGGTKMGAIHLFNDGLIQFICVGVRVRVLAMLAHCHCLLGHLKQNICIECCPH